MSAHAPGRLSVTHNNWEASTLYCEGGVVARVLIESDVDEHTQQHLESVKEDNARRLAACWNACEGIGTESLERSCLLSGMNQKILQLEVQRDNLLQALTRIRALPTHPDAIRMAHKHAEDAISNTKGSAV